MSLRSNPLGLRPARVYDGMWRPSFTQVSKYGPLLYPLVGGS
jgi:hypothetical protein